ncbi:alanine racemase [Aliidiomarina soli]|uniref:Alanine racemase n=1 Tax=Aliidiomarina soli TaxID=1928574 RepID=A0A432WDD7_9GAMM|nr:alanine racemase [Aliidiomarina soli]RUO30403.1 alanine racemase [Aliidiomarina soli]
MRPAWAAIDLAALQHNLEALQQLAKGARILAILKANAYGHGLTRIAQQLDGVDAIGVARLDEALALRNAGVVKPIVLLEGFFAAEQLPILAASGLQPVIHSEYQLLQLEQAKGLVNPLKVWLKVDTGMHRLGVEPEQAVGFYRRLQACPNVQSEPVLMSHFASADCPQTVQNEEQRQAFAAIQAQLQAPVSFSNSAALLAAVAEHDDWVRPGLALYGVSPFAEQTGAMLNLKPVMKLQASVISVRSIGAGAGVGYGAAWHASKSTRIAVLAIGYGDGYPRTAPDGTPVFINGRRYPIVGHVSMDMLAVEVGPDSDVEVGDTGQLWGPDLPVEEVARYVGTIAYELLCNVAHRVVLDYDSV